MMAEYYVYIMASWSKTIYIGVTNDLERRVYEHKHKLGDGFTKKYDVTDLVYFETAGEIESALNRERQIKGWLRHKKTALIEGMNPRWRDLSVEWNQREGRPFASLVGDKKKSDRW